jgi:hypothetical protein
MRASMALQTAIHDRTAELSGIEIAAAYVTTALIDVVALAAMLRLAELNSGARLPLAAAALPLVAVMLGALLLCHALAVAKIAQRQPERPQVSS